MLWVAGRVGGGVVVELLDDEGAVALSSGGATADSYLSRRGSCAARDPIFIDRVWYGKSRQDRNSTSHQHNTVNKVPRAII